MMNNDIADAIYRLSVAKNNLERAEIVMTLVTTAEEQADLLRSELETLRTRHEALVRVLGVARRVLGRRRSDPEMHNRLAAFSTALRQYERNFGPDAAPQKAPDMLAALRAILADPYGCPFCDSGKLRNPVKDHDPSCGYALARAAIAQVDTQ